MILLKSARAAEQSDGSVLATRKDADSAVLSEISARFVGLNVDNVSLGEIPPSPPPPAPAATPAPVPVPAAESDGSSGTSIGPIVGGVVGGIVAVILAGELLRMHEGSPHPFENYYCPSMTHEVICVRCTCHYFQYPLDS